MLGVVVQPELARDRSHGRAAAVDGGCRHHALVRLGRRRIVRRRSRVEPVRELESLVPQTILRELALHPADVSRHGGEGLGQGLPVAVGLPGRPRHPDGGVTPERGRVLAAELLVRRHELDHVRDHEGHHPVGRALLGVKITEPVAEEPAGIEKEDRGRGEDRQVAGPAQPLVALRAVGRHVDEVAALPPDHVAVQLIEHRVGALEFSDALQLRGDDDGDQGVRRQLAGPAGDLGITEAVEGERRLEEVLATAQDQLVGALRGAQRADAELAVLQHLGVSQRDGLATLTADRELQPANEILAEVDQGACPPATARSPPAGSLHDGRPGGRRTRPAGRRRSPAPRPRPRSHRRIPDAARRPKRAARRWSARRRSRRQVPQTGPRSTTRRCGRPAGGRLRSVITRAPIAPSRSPYSARAPLQVRRPRNQPLPSAKPRTTG